VAGSWIIAPASARGLFAVRAGRWVSVEREFGGLGIGSVVVRWWRVFVSGFDDAFCGSAGGGGWDRDRGVWALWQLCRINQSDCSIDRHRPPRPRRFLPRRTHVRSPRDHDTVTREARNRI
jgi:hypothetical protein